jgi:hypothetical protein
MLVTWGWIPYLSSCIQLTPHNDAICLYNTPKCCLMPCTLLPPQSSNELRNNWMQQRSRHKGCLATREKIFSCGIQFVPLAVLFKEKTFYLQCSKHAIHHACFEVGYIFVYLMAFELSTMLDRMSSLKICEIQFFFHNVLVINEIHFVYFIHPWAIHEVLSVLDNKSCFCPS